MRITKRDEIPITVEQHGRIELKQIQYYNNSLVLIVGVDNNKLLHYTVVILNDKIHKIYIDFFYGFLEMALYSVPTRLPKVIQKAIFNKIQSESCHEVEIAA